MRTAGEAPRVDLRRVLTGLRYLTGSAEPGRVFAELAAVCVPALCDEMVIDVEEAGNSRYRIRRPGTPVNRSSNDLPQQGGAAGLTTVNGQSVTVRVTSLPDGGPAFTVRLFCTWHPGYAPTDTDAALVGVLADHATAVVHRERTTGQLADAYTALQVGAALGRVQRVAAATGILMALHHLTATQSRQLLARAGDRTHRSLIEVADSVLTTGALPDHRTTTALTDTDIREQVGADLTQWADIKGRPPDQPVTAPRSNLQVCCMLPAVMVRHETRCGHSSD